MPLHPTKWDEVFHTMPGLLVVFIFLFLGGFVVLVLFCFEATYLTLTQSEVKVSLSVITNAMIDI